jgi:small conductance mechanosensitive channel
VLFQAQPAVGFLFQPVASWPGLSEKFVIWGKNMEFNFGDVFLEYFYDLLLWLPALIWAIVVFSLFLVVGWLLSRWLEKRLAKRKHEQILRIFFVNVIKWVIYLMGFVAAMDILGMGGLLSGVVAGAGVTAIIIGFAFKDIAENFVSGIILAAARPFRIGDIIELNNFRGRVTKIEMRTTHIRTSDGRYILLPNASIIKNPLTNFTRDGLMRYQFSFGVDTPTEVGKVRKIITEYLAEESDVLKKPGPAVTVTELGDYSVTIRVAFWVDLFRDRRKNRVELGEPVLSRVMDRVKDLMVENGVNMPGTIIELKTYSEDEPILIKKSE